MPIARIIATIVLLLNFVGPCAAGALDDAFAAYRKGDYTTAMRLFRPLAEQGQPLAQYTFGYMYAFGQGVPQNYVEAAKWQQKAADQGVAEAQGFLGSMYTYGKGVPKNEAEAAKWYRKAGDQGVAEAQYYLGEAYAFGTGVPKNLAAAAAWYRKAALRGYAGAQASLGNMLMFGKGEAVPLNYDEAVKWDRKAANQDNQMGQMNLALAYAAGNGVPEDNVLAYMWLNIASAKGGLTALLAATTRKMIERQMTPVQIATAQDLARHWKPKKQPGDGASDEAPLKVRQFAGAPGSKIQVPLKEVDGVLAVPVELNGAVKLDFTVDSGAADVSIPSDVFTTLKRTGTIKDSDFLGSQTYMLADGSKSKLAQFTIRSLKVGNVILKDVPASVSTTQGMLLLGQSFLSRFKSWSIDNTNHELRLETR